jgi:hypothetical protein
MVVNSARAGSYRSANECPINPASTFKQPARGSRLLRRLADGEQQLGPYRCFVTEAVPKRKDKYLFEGRVWIDANDYSVVRIEEHPAKKLSFWIQRADFVRQYQKIDGFWLPERDQTLVQVRLYGKEILKIEHRNYLVNAGQSTNAMSTVRETAVTQTN